MRARYHFAVIPAIIFWIVSVIFFVLGLSFGVIQLGTTTFAIFLMNSMGNILFWISIGLAISNTIVQIIGNDADKDEIGALLFWGWMASYVLGIGSNVNSLIQILQITSKWIEVPIAISLGAMIEILPEPLFVLFWRSVFPHGIVEAFKGLSSASRRQVSAYRYSPRTNRKAHSNNSNSSQRRPSGMPRAEWQAYLTEEARQERASRNRSSEQSDENEADKSDFESLVAHEVG